MHRRLFLLLLLGLATLGPAHACSCGPADPLLRTLEQRLDRAELVVLVRIEAAILRPIPVGRWGADGDPALFEAPFFGVGANQYGYRVIEKLKGVGIPLPRIWSENRSNCAERLQVGDFIVVTTDGPVDEIWSSLCNRGQLDNLGSPLWVRMNRLVAIRSYLSSRTPISPCENYVLPPETDRFVCREYDAANWQKSRREQSKVLVPFRNVR